MVHMGSALTLPLQNLAEAGEEEVVAEVEG